MKKLILLLLLSFVLFFVQAQIPSGYYNSATGLTGTALQQALHDIIDNHTVVSYTSLHTHFKSTDKNPNGKVWDMYSDIPGGTPPYEYSFVSGDQCGNYAQEGDCYNREHSFPKSWFDEASPMYSDIHHLYPTDGYVNGQRASYPYGEVDGTSYWTSLNACRIGNNTTPGYTGTVFEPIDEYKGDLARTYFYMATRYYNEDSGWTGSPMVVGSQLKPWALEMLKLWHLADTLSQKEMDRNNAVYGIQNNRNPFIDHPEWVIEIWGPPNSISEKQEIVVDIFPNPAIDELTIICDEQQAIISFYNIEGALLLEYNLDKENNNIRFDFSQGIYYYIIKDEQHRSKIGKLIIILNEYDNK